MSLKDFFLRHFPLRSQICDLIHESPSHFTNTPITPVTSVYSYSVVLARMTRSYCRGRSLSCPPSSTLAPAPHTFLVFSSASKSSIRRFVITEKAPTRAFSWLKAPTSAFTFKTLLRHYAKRALTPQSLDLSVLIVS